MYRGLAESLPPKSLEPNCPIGSKRLTLLDPTKFCARFIIVS